MYELLLPENSDALLDDPRIATRFEQDEYLPYWAMLWPAAVVLADVVAAWEPAPVGAEPASVLELGCGLGLVGLVAAELGYRVTVSDYDADALAFAQENARRNGAPVPLARLIDWRKTQEDLRCDRIVAADVLYEARHLAPLASFIRHHLNHAGFALVSDANRPTADAFTQIARAHGLSVDLSPAARPGSAACAAVRARIFELRGPAAADTRWRENV